MSDTSKEHPSLNEAYELAIRSFDQIRSHWASIDNFFHILFPTSLSIIFSMLILAKTWNMCLISPFPIAILTCFIFVLFFIGYGRLMGEFKMLDYKTYHSYYSQFHNSEYKTKIVATVGEYQIDNVNMINKKWGMARVAITLLIIQSALVVFWIYLHPWPHSVFLCVQNI